jgi:hypothetical protein
MGSRGSWCDGDLLLLAPAVAPTPVPGTADPSLPRGALRHLGETVELGPYPAGTELVLGLAPGGVCGAAGGGARPAPGPFARVARPAAGVWEVWWEDLSPDAADYDDLVVRVEALPAP